MKKEFKYLVVAGLIAALMLAAGCGDDDKEKQASGTNTVEQTVVRPPEGKHYRYDRSVNDVTKTPELTPEVIKYIDEFAEFVELSHSEKGKFTNFSKKAKPDAVYDVIKLEGVGVNNDNFTRFKNDRGVVVTKAEIYHIKIMVEIATKKVKYVELSVYERNKSIPNGKTRVIISRTLK